MMLSTKKYLLDNFSFKLPAKRSKPRVSVLLALLLFALLPSTVSAQNVLPLDSVLLRISNNNPMLQEYGLRAKAQEAYAEGATGWMAPMVGGGVFMYPYPGQRATEGQNAGMLMLSAEQAIPNPAKQRARQNYVRSQAAVENAGREVAYNDLKAQAKSAYYSWVVLEKKLNVLQESGRIMEFMLKLAKIRYPYSQAKLGSLYKAEARQQEVENMKLMVKNEIEQQNIRLNMLMNLPQEQRFMIDTLVAIPQPLIVSADTAYLNSNRSDLHRIDRTIEAMQLNLQLEQLERKPDFRIRFDHMTPRDNMMPQQFSAMGMVSIPIAPWSSKMYRANTRGMNLEIEAMEREREAVLVEAQAMVQSMAQELNTMHHHVLSYQQKIIPALRKNYDVTMLAYEQNTAELPEVLDAWEALNMAQLEYLNNLQQLYLLAVAYEKEIER
ncbi:TolC family protein [Pontibacter harenae]|uniref:TolC family protein n=1 Tax=Pontibacter harenae TaxID=2894083 RepID=UPI001E3D74E2|nr:TolC family protein [Pontibacter harenae]MCC9167436.1 TolC family protein [Pontibacter harenae]